MLNLIVWCVELFKFTGNFDTKIWGEFICLAPLKKKHYFFIQPITKILVSQILWTDLLTEDHAIVLMIYVIVDNYIERRGSFSIFNSVCNNIPENAPHPTFVRVMLGNLRRSDASGRTWAARGGDRASLKFMTPNFGVSGPLLGRSGPEPLPGLWKKPGGDPTGSFWCRISSPSCASWRGAPPTPPTLSLEQWYKR